MELDPVHVGTWGNNPEWTVHTMSVLDKKLHMAHLDGYKYIGPMPQEPFPLRQWVRITVYLYYPGVGDGDTAGMSEDSGCGCTSNGNGGGLPLLGLGLLAALRRRRR